MNKFSKSNHLVINSKEESILLQLGTYGDIKYTFFDQSYKPVETLELHKNNVLKYSTAIDKMDKIHLVALMKSGELNYSICEEKIWSNAIIAKFDFRSKIYNNINILVDDENVNIIYGYANLINSNLWTIQHVINNNQNWNKYNVTKFASHRMSTNFFVDIDSFGTIHLLYRAIESNASQIYHVFYNSYANKWNPIPKKLTSSNANKIFPYIFVDTKDNLHGLWLEEIDKSYILKYSRLTSTGNEKYIWNQIKIPYISDCNNTPIMFEEKGILKIIYPKINSIGYIYSLNSGSTWFEGDIFDTESSQINLVKVSNSTLKSKTTKINDIYCSMNEQLNFYFLDSFNSLNVKLSDHPSCKITGKSNQSIDEIIRIEDVDVEINQLLKSQLEIKDVLNKILDSQNKIESRIEKILSVLETKKDSIFYKLFNSSK